MDSMSGSTTYERDFLEAINRSMDEARFQQELEDVIKLSKESNSSAKTALAANKAIAAKSSSSSLKRKPSENDDQQELDKAIKLSKESNSSEKTTLAANKAIAKKALLQA